MEKKKKVALVFGITSNYVFALANTLIGLLKHNQPFWDDIIVYYDELSQNDIDNVNKIVRCEFVKFSKMDYLKKIPKEALDKYSEACFYRYECFNLLKKYKTVIWNDVDILIQDDISGLLDYANESGFAATENTSGFNNEANFIKLVLDYNMFTPLYNSGILVFKDSLKNYEQMCEWCVKKTIQYSELLRWPDQGILNILLQEFNIKVDKIDINKYCCHPSLEYFIESAAIIHAYGDSKFWSDPVLNNKFPEWEENNKEWKKIVNRIVRKNKKDDPLVSCVMSTYNRTDYLRDAVESILNQTYKNIELIVVLEKCENQDKIENILKSYADPRIKIIKNEKKLGFPLSLNVGLNAAKGKYIARMDDDDISLPERFEKQVSFMESNSEIGICGTNAVFFGKYNSEIGVETDPEILKIITLFRTPFIHPTVMMNAELINKYKLRYNKDYFTEDYELWSRAVSCFPIANINEVLLKYRTGCDNLTSGSNEVSIHNSHKNIMRNQFEKYLNLNINENEIEVLQGRKNVFHICFNFEETLDLKRNLCKTIIKANMKAKFYNVSKLENLLWDYQFNVPYKQPLYKKAIKRIFKPLYRRFMNRVESLICEHDSRIYSYVNEEIKKIKEDSRND